MQKLSSLTLLICFIGIFTLHAQSNLKGRTIDGKKCSLHKVLPKETWSSVSRKYNMSIDEIKSVNHGINDLKIGQIINIPEVASAGNQKTEEQAQVAPSPKPIEQVKSSSAPKSFTHAVVQGETLYGIAKQYFVSVDDLKKWNNLKTNSAKIGQIIFVSNPSGSDEMSVQTTKPSAISSETKKETKPAEIKPLQAEVVKEMPKTLEPKKEIALASPPTDNSKSSSATAKKTDDSKNPVLADAGNKIVAVSDTREKVIEPEVKPAARPEKKSKSKNGNSVVEMTETGMAAWLKDGGINQNKFYGLHRTAPLGTIIKVTNRMNDEYVFVKVVGQLPDTGDNDKQIIKISEAAAKRIGAVDEKFQVELSYGMLQ
jgi:LysM repeat protein